jgi:hypothetical protein
VNFFFTAKGSSIYTYVRLEAFTINPGTEIGRKVNNTITSFHEFMPLGSGECQNKVPERESDGGASRACLKFYGMYVHETPQLTSVFEEKSVDNVTMRRVSSLGSPGTARRLNAGACFQIHTGTRS